jgi:hypothetical protein
MVAGVVTVLLMLAAVAPASNVLRNMTVGTTGKARWYGLCVLQMQYWKRIRPTDSRESSATVRSRAHSGAMRANKTQGHNAVTQDVYYRYRDHIATACCCHHAAGQDPRSSAVVCAYACIRAGLRHALRKYGLP